MNVDLSLDAEQRQLVDSVAALLARESTSDRVRAAEPLGFDGQLWKALSDTGLVEMAVDPGATEVELGLIAEQLGRALASAPLVEAQVAVRLLAAARGNGADLLGRAVGAHALVTFSPRAGRGAELALVPAGAVADAVVCMVDDRLVAVTVDDGNRRPVDNLGSLPLADIAVEDAIVLADGADAEELYASGVDLWLALTALMLAGAARKAVEIGVEYAKQRHTFGSAIGTFQAVSHPLADSATAADGARLLGLNAVCAFADEPGRVRELAAMAFAFGYESAHDATRRSLHIHGGYGFGMEGDIQLYYRRVRGWALVFGDSARALDRVADARYGAVAG